VDLINDHASGIFDAIAAHVVDVVVQDLQVGDIVADVDAVAGAVADLEVADDEVIDRRPGDDATTSASSASIVPGPRIVSPSPTMVNAAQARRPCSH